jgi:uncharacterized protein YabN with tetrapyrrole methylase and pyrophosphatase domain
MSARRDMPFDVAVVGLGMVGVHQLTREAEETLARCSRVFLVDPGFGVAEHIESLGPEVVDLAELYQPGHDRIEAYREMAAAVVDAALADPPVSFASYGHPLVYCYPTTLIRRASALLALKLTVLPGISTLDALFIDLDLDPALNGLQMYEASDLLVRDRPLQPDVPLLVWQASVVGEPKYVERQSRGDGFALLEEHLRRFYPPEHEVTLVLSRTYPLAPSLRESYPLCELAQRLRDGLQVGTLYVPPVAERPVIDSVFEVLGMGDSTQPEVDARPGRPPIGPQPPA